MKRYLVLLILTVTFTGSILAQQSAEFTLYMLNPFIYNPAIAGTANYYQIRSNHRFQWVGFPDAPITNVISAFGPHATKSMGFGGNVYNDITGPVSTTGANAAYAYNFAVNMDVRVSLGIELGALQYKVDGTSLELADQHFYGISDPSLPNSVISKLEPDGSAGVYVYNSQFNAGFSANHLFNLNKKLTVKDLGITRLKTHFYFMGGYRYLVNREWSVEPGFVVSKVVPASYQVEIYCKGIYRNMVWGGLTVRTQDAASIMIGYINQRKIYFAYAFDYPFSDIRKYSAGSQEILIGFNFDNIKRMARRRR